MSIRIDRPSEALDRLTRTFTADRQFFDDLMANPGGQTFIEMCVWYLWLQEYPHDIQNSLHEAGKTYGKDYQVWVVSMVGGIAQSAGMLMYLLSRGVVQESVAAARRALEYLGMLSHLLRGPAKALYLNMAEESPEFQNAFIRGQSRSTNESQKMKSEGIRYCFSAMSDGNAKTASRLYEIFSRFNVHGGTMSSLVSIAMLPTRNSCGFHNRSLEKVADNLRLLKPALEITAAQLMELVGLYGVKGKRVREAGACVLVWLDNKDPRWHERVQAVRLQFGLTTIGPSN